MFPDLPILPGDPSPTPLSVFLPPHPHSIIPRAVFLCASVVPTVDASISSTCVALSCSIHVTISSHGGQEVLFIT